jgi:anti-sigma regulatory factor (Ser/Thr protein kinase)
LNNDEDLGLCELSFKGRPELVSVVRRFISEFYERTLEDLDASSRVARATHELLENSVRYARDGEVCVRIEVTRIVRPEGAKICGTSAHIRIQTRNRAAKEDAAYTDPNLYYLDVIRRSARRTDSSGLGSVSGRIHAEAEMEVSVGCARGFVTVIAETDVELSAAVVSARGVA